MFHKALSKAEMIELGARIQPTPLALSGNQPTLHFPFDFAINDVGIFF